MLVHVLKPIRTDRLGAIPRGRVVDLPVSVGRQYLEQGAVEPFETKELRENPIQASGGPLSASPVAQASPLQTLSVSEPGARKRGRPRKESAPLS